MPNISAYMSSIRPYRWMKLYERLQTTKLSFEIVIVGPIEPTHLLPSNIHFYKSDVKPSQCFHAAATLCTGEILLQMVDDLEYEPDTIEKMFKVVTEMDSATATAHYWQCGTSSGAADGSPTHWKNYVLNQNIAGELMIGLPLLPVCGMFRRSTFIQYQGIDKRFDGVMGELDFYMRLKINGYDTYFVPGRVIENTEWQKFRDNITGEQGGQDNGLCNKFWNKDRECFKRLWTMSGIQWITTRNDIMRPYDNIDLLTVNQYYDF